MHESDACKLITSIFQGLWQHSETARTSSEIFGNVCNSSKHLWIFSNVHKQSMKISHICLWKWWQVNQCSFRVKLIRGAPWTINLILTGTKRAMRRIYFLLLDLLCYASILFSDLIFKYFSLTWWSEYVNRIILYGFQVWGCQLTGKTNLKYGEAVASEEQTLKRLESFPKYLEKPILQLVHHSKYSLHICAADNSSVF